MNPRHGHEGFDKKYYRRFFDRYSKKEFEVYCRWADGWVRFLDNYLDIKNGSGKNLLELGASLGYFSRIFKDREFDVSASDISAYIIKKAGLLQRDINFFKLNIEGNIEIDSKFDFIIAFEVLEHLRNPEVALKNVKKMLKRDGTLIFSTPFPTKRSLADSTHINVHEASWWLNLAKKVGFRKMKIVYATFVPFLYRISSIFSWGFPFKTDIPFVNSTAFYIFTK